MSISKLYSLIPIGVGSKSKESLTSYLSRLADAHCVTTGTLVGKEVVPILGKEYIIKSNKNGGNLFYKFGNALNGLGKLADDFAQCLSELTGEKNLKSLTLVSLHDVLPIRDVFRPNKAWCPLCFEDWRKNKNLLYEPLIWSFCAVKICEIHGTMLNTRCPNCRMEIPVISQKSRNGFCSFCGCWLGSFTINGNEGMCLEQLKLENFITANIGSLINNVNPLGHPSRLNIFKFIKMVVDKVGGVCAFSRYFNIPKSSVSQWLEGLHRPALQTILKICYCLKMNLIEAISCEQTQTFYLPKESLLDARISNKRNYKPRRKSIDWNAVENMLREVINNKTAPPPSVNEVAKNLGYAKRLLYYHFSALCKKISENHNHYIGMMKEQRIKAASLMVTEAVKNIKESGRYPSRRRIEEMISPHLLLRERANQIAWKKALIDANLLTDIYLNSHKI